MSAKEMFEELGYRLVDVIDHKGEVAKHMIEYERYDGNFYWVIRFNNSTKSMHTHCKIFNRTIKFTCFPPELLKAIHKQIEELGWLDE